MRTCCLFIAVLHAATVTAQTPRFPFDPPDMFERMFGEDSPADREALAKIDVSVAEERRLGEQILQAGLASLKEQGITIETKGRDVEYLQSLVELLTPMLRHKDRYPSIRVMVARSPKVDARSCPGGTLLFFEGMLDACGSEAALVCVVGHELSHLDRGHQLLPIKRMKLMERTFADPKGPVQFFQSGPSMMKLWARPFRPEDEADADRDGVAWAYAAGYDPRELAKLFQKHTAKPGLADTEAWPTFFRTHPVHKERQQAVLKQYNQLQKQQPKESLFIGVENLKQRHARDQ